MVSPLRAALLAILFAVIPGAGSLARASIHEVGDFAEILAQLKPGAILVLDIDKTLLFRNRLEDETHTRLVAEQAGRLIESEGLRPDVAKSVAVRMVEEHEWGGPAEAVDPRIPALIREVQDHGVVVVGLTARGTETAEWTRNQLLSVGIDLYRSPVMLTSRPKWLGDKILYDRGILFVEDESTHKGDSLFTLLERARLKPEGIVYADDKLWKAREVDDTARMRGVSVRSFHYTAGNRAEPPPRPYRMR